MLPTASTAGKTSQKRNRGLEKQIVQAACLAKLPDQGRYRTSAVFRTRRYGRGVTMTSSGIGDASYGRDSA
jgi:hypothetical protein